MATKEIAWDSTSTDKITIAGTSFGENQQISISSSENRKPTDRSKDIVLSTSHTPRKSVTITVGQKRATITASLSIPDVSFTAAGGPFLVVSTLSIFVNGNLAETKKITPTFSYTSSWLTNTSATFNAKSRGTVLGDALSTIVSASYTETSDTYGNISAQTQFTATQQANTREHTSNLARFLFRGAAWVSNPLEVSPAGGLVGMEGFYMYTYSSGSTKSEAVDIALDSFRSSADWAKVFNYHGFSIGCGCSKQPNIASSRSCQMWFEQAGFVSNKIDITQIESVATTVDYATPVVTLAALADIPAKGGSVSSGTVTYSQTKTQHYSNGNTAALSSVTTGGSVSFNTVSANSLGTTVKARTQVGTLTASVTLNGKSGTASQPVYQQANAATTITYGTPVVNVTAPDVPAKGGSVTSGTATYSQPRTQNYTSTATSSLSALTSGGTVTWSGGASGISSLGTTIKARTAVGSALVCKVTMNGKEGSKSVTVYQQANTATYGNLSGGSATASDIPASGGTRSATVTNPTQTVSFTSGSSRAGSVTSSQTAAISGSNLTTTVKARTKLGTITVTFSGEGSKKLTKTVDVYQAANSRTLASVSLEFIFRDNTWATSLTTIPANGTAPAGMDVYGNYTYTSESTSKIQLSGSDIPKSASTISVPWASAYSSGGGTVFQGVKCTAQTSSDTGARSGTVYVTVSGKKSNTLTFTQVALAASLRLSATTLSSSNRSESKSVSVTSNPSYNVKK